MTENPAQSAIIISGVVKQFGRFAALRGVSAEFDAGRFHAILGDNGAGKTTLLRALAGLAHPTQGTIRMFGKAPQDSSREIGYMAHPSLLYDEMSGMENLRYFARLYEIAGDERCAEVIRAVGLDPELTRPVGQYSQGMRQRMSLARAILHDPKLLLLDEPFSNVDVHSAREMVALLKDMRGSGKTIFVVTHQALLLDGVADEFVWMQEGRIVDRTAAPAPRRGGAVNSLWAVTAATLVKDIRLEWRSKDALNSMLFFSLLVVVIFVFSFDPLAEESRHIVGGLVWVAFLFAAVVALNQTWARELRNQVLDAYRVSPAPANALFLAKTLGNFIFVCVLEALMTPLFVDFLQPACAGSSVAIDSDSIAGNLGAGGERDLFRGDVTADAQSRDHAAVVAVSGVDSRSDRHGGRYHGHSHWGEFRSLLHRVASHLRCGVYYS